MTSSVFVPLNAIEQLDDKLQTILPKTFERLNALETVLLCIKLNHFTSYPDISIKKQQIQCLQMLSNDQYIRTLDAQRILEFVQMQERLGDTYIPFGRPGLLEAIRWSCVYSKKPGADSFRIQSHMQGLFLRALLASNDLYTKREVTAESLETITIDNVPVSYVKGARKAMNWAILQKDPLLALGRASLLMGDHFLRTSVAYSDLFEQSYGISGDEWLAFHAALIGVGLDFRGQYLTNASSFNDLFEWREHAPLSGAPHLVDKFQHFLNLLGISLKELKTCFVDNSISGNQDFPWRALRSTPIFRMGSGRAIIIDRRMFLENMIAGPLFSIKKRCTGEDHFKHFGEAFQAYMLQLLTSINNSQVTQNRCNHLVNEPKATPRPLNDILLATDTCCALIEAKGVWLNDDILNELDDEKFLAEIFKKYAQPGGQKDAEGRKIRAKGLPQLANVIKDLEQKALTILMEEAQFISDIAEIVPVLLVYDGQLTESLMTQSFAKKFAALLEVQLGAVGNFQYGSLLVHHLVLLSMEDLETLDRMRLDRPLPDLLRQYSNLFPERLYPFGWFLQDCWSRFEVVPIEEQVVRARALEVMDNVAKLCFQN